MKVMKKSKKALCLILMLVMACVPMTGYGAEDAKPEQTISAAAIPADAVEVSDLDGLKAALTTKDHVKLTAAILITDSAIIGAGDMSGKTVWLNGYSFRITDSANLDFNGLVLDGDDSGGGIYYDEENPAGSVNITIQNVTLKNIKNAGDYGVIYLGKGTDKLRKLADATLDKVTITNCDSTNIIALHGDSVLRNVTVENCFSGNAPKGVVSQHVQGKKLELTECLIKNNTLQKGSSGLGAGVYSSGDLEIVQSRIMSNKLDSNGSAMGGGVLASGNLYVKESIIAGNGSSGHGGGIGIYDQHQVSPSAIIENSVISGNDTAGNGGGIFAYGVSGSQIDITIRDSHISFNSADQTGGGVCNGTVGTVSVTGNSTVSGNVADGTGGGVYTHPSGALVIEDSAIIAGNTGGGGKADTSTTPSAILTVAFNGAPITDGAILAVNAPVVSWPLRVKASLTDVITEARTSAGATFGDLDTLEAGGTYVIKTTWRKNAAITHTFTIKVAKAVIPPPPVTTLAVTFNGSPVTAGAMIDVSTPVVSWPLRVVSTPSDVDIESKSSAGAVVGKLDNLEAGQTYQVTVTWKQNAAVTHSFFIRVAAATGQQDTTPGGDVKPDAVPKVQTIRTPLKSIRLTKNKTYQIPLALDAAGGKPVQDSGLKVTSGKPAVISVIKSGAAYKLKALKVGVATVTIRAQNGRKIAIRLTVVKKAVALKSFAAKTPKTLKAGKAYQITLSKLTKNATNVTTVTFKSSNAKIASVDKAGKITAFKKGKVKITIKVGMKKVIKTIQIK